MKKLLGLLATAPLAMAACGSLNLGTHTTVATAYYLGRGQEIGTEGLVGKQNDHYNLIEVKLHKKKNNGDVLEMKFEITESTGYYNTTIAFGSNAMAIPNWVEDETVLNPGNGFIAAADVNAAWPGSVSATSGNHYNAGESLRYIYDTVEISETEKNNLVDAEGEEINFVSKLNNGVVSDDDFTFADHSTALTSYLNASYTSCEDIDTVTDARIKELARNKEDDPLNSVNGSTAVEARLYIAAALRTAKTYCDGL